MIFVQNLLVYILIGVIVFIAFICVYSWSINHNTAFSKRMDQAKDKTYQDMGFENADEGFSFTCNVMKKSWKWLIAIVAISILFWPVNMGMILYNYLKNKSH